MVGLRRRELLQIWCLTSLYVLFGSKELFAWIRFVVVVVSPLFSALFFQKERERAISRSTFLWFFVFLFLFRPGCPYFVLFLFSNRQGVCLSSPSATIFSLFWKEKRKRQRGVKKLCFFLVLGIVQFLLLRLRFQLMLVGLHWIVAWNFCCCFWRLNFSLATNKLISYSITTLDSCWVFCFYNITKLAHAWLHLLCAPGKAVI